MKVCTACGSEYGDELLFCNRDGTPLRPSGGQTADLVGQVIAERYHIQKKLGEGGMGQVYLAEHVKMGRRCAIKIMSPAMMKDPDAISRFNREAANASRIGHPNVCAIYDFGETPEGLIYLAMEFIEGRSLNAILEEAGTLPLARAATMITQCADALQVAHDLGIVHRDLKPDNIMVMTARGRDTVKVVDFGIAKAVGGADEGAQKVTKTGFVVGTPEYMSPEQLAGDPIDGRSDLYSLALVFYRMLTGSTPFPADSQQETMIKRLTDDPLPLGSARPDIRFPPQLQRVMDRALARTPDERYPSAAEFARDVRSVSSSATGQVDVEAGTQQLAARARAAEQAAGGDMVPATRIDPAIEKQRVKAAAEAAKNAPAVPTATRGEKKFPMVPVAIGIVALAVAGGGYVLRDKFTGGGTKANPAQVDSSKLGQGPVTPDSQKPLALDTTKRVASDTVQLSHQTSGTVPDPGKKTGTPGPKTPRDTVVKPSGTVDEQSGIVLPSIDAIDEASTRVDARKQAVAVYNNTAAPVNLRARAAHLASLAYDNDQNYREALVWLENSNRLRPSDQMQNLINEMKRKLGNP